MKSVNEERHLLERQRSVHHDGHKPVTSIEFLWPWSPRDWAKGVTSGVYFYLMKMQPLSFFLTSFLYYVIISLVFAGLYFSVGSELEPRMTSFVDAMLYSMGRMCGLDGRFDALGTGASVISLFQAFLSLLSGAILTGLIYGRFASPKSSFMFSKPCVITTHERKDAIMFRIANSRRGFFFVISVC